MRLIAALHAGPWPFSYCPPDEIEEYRNRIKERLAGIGISVSGGKGMYDVRAAANHIRLTTNIGETVASLRESGIFQAAASNDLRPFVYGVAKRLGGMDLIETAPVKVTDGEERVFEAGMLGSDATIVGDFKGGYNGVERALNQLEENYRLGEVALVAGNDPDITSMRNVRESGGIAIGFNPDVDVQRMLERRGLPILLQEHPDISPVLEMVEDPEKVDYYCV